MNGKALWWGVLVIGVALIVAPLAMGLPSKSAAGERMINDFQPIMAADQVQKTADYYYKVFVPLGQITPMYTNANAAKFQSYLAGMQAAGLQIPPAGGEGLHPAHRLDEAGGSDRLAGPGRARALQAARRRDAGQRERLQAALEPAEVHPVHVVLRRAGRPARAARRASASMQTDAVHLRHHKAQPVT